MQKTLIMAGALAVLAGCEANYANLEKDFLCEAQLGTPCTTLAEADGGSVRAVRSIAENPNDTLASTLSQDPLLTAKGSRAGGVPSGMANGGTSYNAKAYRLPEKIGTAWVAPYLDEGGVLHEATWIHFVLLEPEWGNRR